jgi:2-oxo-3-hexenedioate decarboxylase
MRDAAGFPPAVDQHGMTDADLASFAERLDTAALNAGATPQITLSHPRFCVDEAYAVQRLLVARRGERGEGRAGYKMGLTSRAKMQQVGVTEVIWGRLTHGMRLTEGGSLSRARYVHPRAEPEIAFVMRRRLSGEVTAAEALAAVEAVAPGVEIIDSRYENFKFTLPDVVADNASSSGFFLGAWARPDTDIGNLGIAVEANGRAVEIGSSAAILGHPLRALVAAARLVGRAGEALEPGDIVLAGAATAAHALLPGMYVEARFQSLGRVAFSVEA